MHVMNARGNIVAVIVTFAVVLVFLLVLGTQKNPEMLVDKYPSKQITGETQAAMERAFEDAIKGLANTGYDDGPNEWYLDKPLPPRVDLVSNSIHNLLRQLLLERFEELKNERGYSITGPLSVTFDINHIDYSSWISNPPNSYSVAINNDANEYQVAVDINIVTAGVTKDTTGDKNKILNIEHTRFIKKIRLWYDYDRIVDWMATDAGSISTKTAALIGNCGVRKCNQLADLGTSTLGLERPGWSASENEAKKIADSSLASLNAHLSGDSIQCSIDQSTWEYHENSPKERARYTTRNDYCSCPGGDTYYENLSWQCPWIPPPPLPPEEEGCLKSASGDRAAVLWSPFNQFGKGTQGYRNNSFGPSTPDVNPTLPLNKGIAFHESVGSTAMFSAVYKIACEDQRSAVAKAAEFGPLKIVLVFKFSAKRDCDPQPPCNGTILSLKECENGDWGENKTSRVCYNYNSPNQCSSDTAGTNNYTCNGGLFASLHNGNREACCIENT